VITELFKGRTVDQARRLTKADLLLILGGLPDGKESCAEMAVNALQLALTSKEGN
jgi:NifU-like protein